MKSNKLKAILQGLISAMFFAVTFVFNRLISIEGGTWAWSASLRFFWMIPLLFIIVAARKKFLPLLLEMKKNLLSWLLWSTVGFGIFYAPLTFAAKFGPSWLVAGTWQTTIVAGLLISPLISKKNNNSFSFRSLGFSLIILLGIGLMQATQAQKVSEKELLFGIVPVIIAAFAYPLGNRKMMQLTNGKLSALQRTLGMTLASFPFWLILSFYEISRSSLPTGNQIIQTLVVAICSGVIATTLFFMATDKVRRKEKDLAAVEATQSTEVLFALIGEIVFLQTNLPSAYACIGIGLVVIGMVLHSIKH